MMWVIIPDFNQIWFGNVLKFPSRMQIPSNVHSHTYPKMQSKMFSHTVFMTREHIFCNGRVMCVHKQAHALTHSIFDVRAAFNKAIIRDR